MTSLNFEESSPVIKVGDFVQMHWDNTLCLVLKIRSATSAELKTTGLTEVYIVLCEPRDVSGAAYVLAHYGTAFKALLSRK